MRYVSLFSGIEAASAAWSPLGWEPVSFSEIDPSPSAVLACRFPGCVHPIRDMRGRRFGMLTVVGYAGRRNRRDTMWFCRCDCGKVGTKAGRNLTGGHSKSCGCQRGRKKGGTYADQEHKA